MRAFGEVLMIVGALLFGAFALASGYIGVPLWRASRRAGESPVHFRTRRRVRALDRLPLWVPWLFLFVGLVGLALNQWG
jgi:hypothetical protein